MTRPTVRTWTLTLLCLVAVGLTACATLEPGPSLYKRLGGREGIALVVGDFVTIAAGDARVNARFKGLDGARVERLKSNFADQLCEASGGPCSYVGRDMKTAHHGMNITEAEWNATVEDLVKALDRNHVGDREKQEVLALLGPMKPDIVGQ